MTVWLMVYVGVPKARPAVTHEGRLLEDAAAWAFAASAGLGLVVLLPLVLARRVSGWWLLVPVAAGLGCRDEVSFRLTGADAGPEVLGRRMGAAHDVLELLGGRGYQQLLVLAAVGAGLAVAVAVRLTLLRREATRRRVWRAVWSNPLLAMPVVVLLCGLVSMSIDLNHAAVAEATVRGVIGLFKAVEGVLESVAAITLGAWAMGVAVRAVRRPVPDSE